MRWSGRFLLPPPPRLFRWGRDGVGVMLRSAAREKQPRSRHRDSAEHQSQYPKATPHPDPPPLKGGGDSKDAIASHDAWLNVSARSAGSGFLADLRRAM